MNDIVNTVGNAGPVEPFLDQWKAACARIEFDTAPIYGFVMSPPTFTALRSETVTDALCSALAVVRFAVDPRMPDGKVEVCETKEAFQKRCKEIVEARLLGDVLSWHERRAEAEATARVQ